MVMKKQDLDMKWKKEVLILNNYEEDLKEINRLADKETYKLEKQEALDELETLRTYLQALRPSNLEVIEKQINKIKSILESKGE